MNLYTFTIVVAVIALVITAVKYFFKRPDNLLLCYFQDFAGVLFIYSGFLKAVDPLGFSYKLEEYFEVFEEYTASAGFIASLMSYCHDHALILSVFMTMLEMSLGWNLIFGIWMKLTSWLMLLLILFFTFLTAFSWYTGKITDCGCFGDAIKLSNAETFYKNIVLTAIVLYIFLLHRKITPVFGKLWTNILLIIGVAGSLYLQIYCLRNLPLIDFRPYKIGNDIREEMSIPPGAPRDSIVTELIYKDKNTGEEKGFTMKDLPWQDSVWMANHEFARQENVVVKQGFKPKITDFKVWSDDSPDITTQILDTAGYKIWIIAYDLTKTDVRNFKNIVTLANECEKNNIQVIGLTSSSYETADHLRHELNATFPFYYCDGTVLKTMIRSNPGVMLLNQSKVISLWHYNNTPTFEQLKKKYLEK